VLVADVSGKVCITNLYYQLQVARIPLLFCLFVCRQIEILAPEVNKVRKG